jgi:hypothetical protein
VPLAWAAGICGVILALPAMNGSIGSGGHDTQKAPSWARPAPSDGQTATSARSARRPAPPVGQCHVPQKDQCHYAPRRPSNAGSASASLPLQASRSLSKPTNRPRASFANGSHPARTHLINAWTALKPPPISSDPISRRSAQPPCFSPIRLPCLPIALLPPPISRPQRSVHWPRRPTSSPPRDDRNSTQPPTFPKKLGTSLTIHPPIRRTLLLTHFHF